MLPTSSPRPSRSRISLDEYGYSGAPSRRVIRPPRSGSGCPVRGVDEDRIVVDDFAVLFPFGQLRHKVVAHQDRESHLRTVVLRQVTQGVDRVRRFVEHEFDDRRFDLVGIFRCGACGFRHREAIQLRSLLSGGLERVLRRNHQYDFVAESFFDRIFGQRDVALVDRIEGPEVEHYVFHGIVCFVVYFFVRFRPGRE